MTDTKATTAIIEAVGVTKRFGEQEVVRRISFTVPRGQCFGLLGPNGAGKTTTIKMILGQSHLTAGVLTVFGKALPDHASAVRARTGVVPQEDDLDPDFTIAENLRVYAGYFGLEGGDLSTRIAELLHFVSLTDRADARVDQLSGGMKRRLTIARALINDPDLVVLDEPTTGLDPQARHMIWARLRDLKQSGKTLLLTTHYMEEAERLCDDLLIIDHGAIIAQGSPKALIRAHVEPEVVELRGAGSGIETLLGGDADCRIESVGDTVYCYTHDSRPLTERLQAMPELSFLHRPANLEDVFLNITGRDLRE